MEEMDAFCQKSWELSFLQPLAGYTVMRASSCREENEDILCCKRTSSRSIMQELPRKSQNQTCKETWSDHKACIEAIQEKSSSGHLMPVSPGLYSLEKQHAWKYGETQFYNPEVETLIWAKNKKGIFFPFLKSDAHFNVNILKPFKTRCEDLIMSFVIVETLWRMFGPRFCGSVIQNWVTHLKGKWSCVKSWLRILNCSW